MTVRCSIKEELFFLSIKIPRIFRGFFENLSLVDLIGFVLIIVYCPFNKLHMKSYPTYYPHIYREILLTRQDGKHSLSTLFNVLKTVYA